MEETLRALLNVWGVLAAPLWAVFLPALVWGRRRYEAAERRRLSKRALAFTVLSVPAAWGGFYAAGLAFAPAGLEMHPVTYASEMAVLGFPFAALFATALGFLLGERKAAGPEGSIPWRPWPIRFLSSLLVALALLIAGGVELTFMAAAAGVYRGWR